MFPYQNTLWEKDFGVFSSECIGFSLSLCSPAKRAGIMFDCAELYRHGGGFLDACVSDEVFS